MELVFREERAYRNWSKKCTEAKERSILLDRLVKNGVGQPEIENFARQEEGKRRVGGKVKKFVVCCQG